MAPSPERAKTRQRPRQHSSRQTLAAMRAPIRQDLAAADGRHAGTEAVAAFANKLARLICSLHGTSPVRSVASRESTRNCVCASTTGCVDGVQNACSDRRHRTCVPYGGWPPASQPRARSLNAGRGRPPQHPMPDGRCACAGMATPIPLSVFCGNGSVYGRGPQA